ncbi:MAG: hypothetical protein K8H88_35010, partial [Sandaracinaceae bacterium]|nr:hypothetical protein [Sandaracinaceae bacterium]
MSLPGGLTFEVMGAFGLFVFWLNVGLVVLAAIRDARKLQSRLRMVVGRVHRARAVGSAPIARHVIEQVGRAPQDGEAIHFHDRRHRSELLDGELEIEGERVAVAATEDVEIWALPGALRPSVEPAFEDALAAAKRARGFERDMALEVSGGDAVWVVGSVEDGRLEP